MNLVSSELISPETQGTNFFIATRVFMAVNNTNSSIHNKYMVSQPNEEEGHEDMLNYVGT